VDAAFDLRPMLAAQWAERHAARWRLRAFYTTMGFILVLWIWLGYTGGLALFTLSVIAIGGVLTTAVVIIVRRRGDSTELRVSSSGLELRFNRGRPLIVA
jgi:hypothetical protein